MAEPTFDELVGLLESDDAMAQAHAAAELGERGERLAVAPLTAALARLEFELDHEFHFAGEIVRALAQLGAVDSSDAIVETLRKTCGHDVVPFVACEALVQLRAVASLPALRSLLEDPDNTDHAERLSEAIVALGGEAEAPFFVDLLKTRREDLKLAAIAALGALRHQPAILPLRKLIGSKSDDVRIAALAGLVAIGAPGADEEVREHIARARTQADRAVLLDMVRRHSIASVADLLVEKALDPMWVQFDEFLLETLTVAADLGSTEAVLRLERIAVDPAHSPCARARAGSALLDRGQARRLEPCLDFLRRNGGHLEKDGRDDWGRCNRTQSETIDALERFAARNVAGLLPVVDCLDGLRRGKYGNPGFLEIEASRVVCTLTGTELYAELDAWRAARGAST